MKIDVASARARAGSRYPKPFDEPCLNKTPSLSAAGSNPGSASGLLTPSRQPGHGAAPPQVRLKINKGLCST